MPFFNHFDFIAPYYDRVLSNHSMERLISLLELNDCRGGVPPSLLLDVGGGTGRIAQALKGTVSSIIVADASIGMLYQAAGKGDLYTICTLSEAMPFPPSTFVRIIMVDALHHVYNATRTAQELWRLLKPGGKIIIEEPDIRIFMVKLVALAEKLALMRSHFLSPQDISRLFTSSNARTQIERNGFSTFVIVEKCVAE